jgi:SAM-dependent methyltransferase
MSTMEPDRPDADGPEDGMPDPEIDEPGHAEPGPPGLVAPDHSLVGAMRAEPSLVRRDLVAYGADAPVAVDRLTKAAVGFALAMLVGAFASSVPVMAVALFASFAAAVLALGLVWSSRAGKLRERILIVDALELADGDRVLDIGCGRGLVTVEAARRLGAGVAIGVDLWKEGGDPSAVPTVLWDNASIEGVDDRVEVAVGDARSLPVPDATFDVVVSVSTLRGLADDEARARAVDEAARALRPGGRLALVDTRYTKASEEALRARGWPVTRSKRSWGMFPPVRTVSATRPTT